MTVYHRIVSVILLFVFIVLALLALIYFLGLVPAHLYLNLGQNLYANPWAVIVALVLFIASIWAIAPYFIKMEPPQTIIHAGELGEVSVSLSAVEGLVQRIVADQEGIREAKTKVKPDGETLKVLLQISVSPQVEIPNLNIQLQEKVKNYIAKATGVIVSKVEILVRNIDAGPSETAE